MDLPVSLLELQGDQFGVFTRVQARTCGLTKGEIRWALGRTWLSLLPGVYVAHRAPAQPRQRIMAAQLYAGEDAVISGAAACRWRGLEHAANSEVVHVVVPASCSTRRVRWVDIRRSAITPGVHRSGPLRLASPERAVVDAARRSPGVEQATALVIEAVQRRMTTLDRLVHVNDTVGRRHSAVVSEALREASWGAWSVPEVGLARLVASSRVLPTMWCNPSLTAGEVDRPDAAAGVVVITPDGWFDDVGMAVMVHSRKYHDGTSWVTTVERDGELTAQGAVVCQVTPASLRQEPARVLAFLEKTYVVTRATRVRSLTLRARRWAPWQQSA